MLTACPLSTASQLPPSYQSHVLIKQMIHVREEQNKSMNRDKWFYQLLTSTTSDHLFTFAVALCGPVKSLQIKAFITQHFIRNFSNRIKMLSDVQQ